MSSETRRNVGEVLAAQLEAMEAGLSARADAHGYGNEMRRQRDSARRFAVDYEQTAYEMTRRVNLAAAFLDEIEPTGPDIAWAKAELAEILRGDR